MIVAMRLVLPLVCSLTLAPALAAQASSPSRHARLEGKWQAKAEDEIRNIMVRSDSSAQFGDKVARSGGDLEKPATLRRVGPPTARADSVAIPPPPSPTERAWD